MSDAAIPGAGAVPQGSGLTATEAVRRLAQVGPNEVPERREPAWRRAVRRLWGPLPWMLEVTIALTLVLGKFADAAVIGFLLVFNAAVAFLQEGRAERAVALLRTRLHVQARVLRDGTWLQLAARELVPGDIVHVRVGDLVPADVRVLDGEVQLDQSAITGESLPVEARPGATAYSGSVVTRGEATGEVVATGASSVYGRTTELVSEARTATHLEAIVLGVVRYLVAIDGLLVVAVLAVGLAVHQPLRQLLPYALILLIASVPVALPATFTVAQALASRELGGTGPHGGGVLVARLSAVQEAASIDVLCVDKTGTITQNRLRLADVHPYPPTTAEALVEWAALASDEASQDPIDLAILEAQPATAAAPTLPASRLEFVPFDPATKRTEAVVRRDGQVLRVLKGMPQVVAGQCPHPPATLDADVARLAEGGSRVLAVAAGPTGQLSVAGLVALADQPRPDSAALVADLRGLGITVKMVTGDAAPTARAIARQVGIGDRVCERAELVANPQQALSADVFAGVFPEDKFDLVRALQRAGHVVAMTGDGVNDAPALKQAEVGIAVASATDVAKASASLVLTDAGLANVVDAVLVSRRAYQRMMTWTLNKIVKTTQVALFLAGGFFATRTFVTTPLLMVLLLVANDFATMAIAADNARASRRPNRWRVGALAAAALPLALVALGAAFAVLFIARDALDLTGRQVQTAVFVMLVFTGQATLYVVRERGHLWDSRPARPLVVASAADVMVVAGLATTGVLMTSITPALAAAIAGIAVGTMLVMDPVKVLVLRRAGLV